MGSTVDTALEILAPIDFGGSWNSLRVVNYRV
jgi:hypothetical protein